MPIRATLQTKLACGALLITITNVCIIIAIIAYISNEEMCKLKRKKVSENDKLRTTIPAELHLQVSVDEYPWIVEFTLLPFETFVGTAVIIEKYWAVTTADCILKYPLKCKGFRGGSSYWNRRGYYHYAAAIHVHHEFTRTTLDYNIALIKVIQPFVHIYEAPATILPTYPQILKRTVVVGWALNRKKPKSAIENLLRIDVEIITKELCQKLLERSNTFASVFTPLCSYKIADKYHVHCDFSSGSALLMSNRYLLGLVSSNVMCHESEIPGTYINISLAKDWINSILL